MRLADKIALITGGGRGIGRVIALAFAREGADVAICARTEEQLKSTAAEVEQLGRRCFFQVCDVTVNDQCVAVVQGALRHFGRLDILVNNAGGGDVAQYSTVAQGRRRVVVRQHRLEPAQHVLFLPRGVAPHGRTPLRAES